MMNREPALIVGAIQSLLALLVAFGLNLSPEQVGAILALSSAVFAVMTRSVVYSPRSFERATVRVGNTD